MLRVEIDALGPDERLQLDACVAAAKAEGGPGELRRRLALFTILGFFLLAPPLLGLSFFIGWHPSVVLLLLGPAVGAVAAVVTHGRFESRRSRRQLALEEDLARGEAEVLVAESERGATVGGDEESPSGAFFLEVGGGELLYLQGPVLEDCATGLPSSRVTVRLGPKSRVVLGVECGGEPLEPSSELEALRAWAKGYPRDDRAFLVRGTLEHLDALVRGPEFLRQIRSS